MSSVQQGIDCPNLACATPAALGLCTRFAVGLGLQIGRDGTESGRWDDTHCLVCGLFSSPYAQTSHPGRDLRSPVAWLSAVDRALVTAKRGRLDAYLEANELGIADLLAMRQAVRRLQVFAAYGPSDHGFPHIGLLRVGAAADVPDTFGVAHGEAESEGFARKVQVLGRLLGARSTETSPRLCAPSEPHFGWYFYRDEDFIGLLTLAPNRGYRGTMTIDGCLNRLLHAS